jgi:large subunit ribosomal protein L23
MAVKSNKAANKPHRSDFGVLIRPVVTEKSSLVGGGGGGIVFKVRKGSSKTEIKEAVERIFKVEVASVRTVNTRGKLKRTTRNVGKRADQKKAYISLKEGHTIDIVEGL